MFRHLLFEASTGTFEPGALLPREIDLAERFDVSRGVTRDALQALRERQVVAVRHGAGARVLPVSEWNLLDDEILAVLMRFRPHAQVRAEVIEALRQLEPPAASLAAERAEPEVLSTLAMALERMTSPDGIATYVLDEPRVRGQAAFHDALMSASGNRPLRRMTRPLHIGLAVMAERLPKPRRRARLVEQHERLLESIRVQRPQDARRAVEKLLDDLADAAK